MANATLERGSQGDKGVTLSATCLSEENTRQERAEKLPAIVVNLERAVRF